MATAIRNNVGVGEDALRQIEKQFRLTNRASNYAIYDFNWFCRQFESTYSHIHIEQQINIDESEVPDSLKTVIFRIFQEAMNNIAKHSKADHIHLLFRKTDGAIELGIQDTVKASTRRRHWTVLAQIEDRGFPV